MTLDMRLNFFCASAHRCTVTRRKNTRRMPSPEWKSKASNTAHYMSGFSRFFDDAVVGYWDLARMERTKSRNRSALESCPSTLSASGSEQDAVCIIELDGCR